MPGTMDQYALVTCEAYAMLTCFSSLDQTLVTPLLDGWSLLCQLKRLECVMDTRRELESDLLMMSCRLSPVKIAIDSHCTCKGMGDGIHHIPH